MIIRIRTSEKVLPKKMKNIYFYTLFLRFNLLSMCIRLIARRHLLTGFLDLKMIITDSCVEKVGNGLKY